MKRTRRRRPYSDGGRTSFPLRRVPGVYLIYDDQGGLVYVGYGAKEAYKPLYRHFQVWNDKTRVRTTFDRDTHTVRIIYTRTAAQAARLERALIIKHRPPGNPNKLEQYELGEDLKRIAEAGESAPFMPRAEEAPF